MTGNDVLRRLRYALDMGDETMIEVFRLGKKDVTPRELEGFLKKDEEEEGFIPCPPVVLGSFLEGLILLRRGPREDGSPQPPAVSGVTNNVILKKLRIALELKEEDMLNVFRLGEFPLSKSELTALFRKEGHKNYKSCGDQLVKKFLKGLTVLYRKGENPDLSPGE